MNQEHKAVSTARALSVPLVALATLLPASSLTKAPSVKDRIARIRAASAAPADLDSLALTGPFADGFYNVFQNG